MSDVIAAGWSNMLGMKIVSEKQKHILKYPQRIEPEQLFGHTYRGFGTVSIQQGEYYIPDDRLDPRYNYDFSKEKDDGKVYWRGPYRYYRPYGWKRFALKVKGRYENDTWLGEDGIRTDTTPGEWPVSYHGTDGSGAKGVAKEGFQDKYLKRDAYGKGHYSSPKIDVAEQYAHEFQYEGKKYKVVLQNRVNMSCTETKHAGGTYWLTKDQAGLRAYGILLKQLN